MKIELNETTKNRKDLAKLFTGVGAEIGVERAVFSKRIAQTATKLFCIDPWLVYKGYREHVTQENLDTFFKEAQDRMKPYNCQFIRKSSMDAVKDFTDESLDFVYIDANHQYDNVRDDIREWSKKVKKGGIVAGHDYLERKEGDTFFGVVKALSELDVELTIWRGDKSPSWSYIKS